MLSFDRLALGLGLVLGLALILQALLSLRFIALVRERLAERDHWPTAPPEGWPAAEVVLCLRGADPTLAAGLEALAAQRYPAPWRLRLVVDSREDPAWDLAQSSLKRLERSGAGWTEAHQEPLAGWPPAGSLKSASLRQAFATLNPQTQLVALVDADAVVHPQWLEQLARACGQPGVGAVSGNRWYRPRHDSAAGRVRSIWNAGAVVLMTVLSIPWGGSLAVRREVIDAGDWSDVLARSLCEDTALIGPLRLGHWRYQFRPELMVVDEDDGVALGPLRRWISRQLLTARLHHPAWGLAALHGLGTSLLLAGSMVVAIALLTAGQLPALAALVAALLVYELGCTALLMMIEAAAGLALGPEAAGQAGFRRWFRRLALSQGIYGLACLQASLARRVEWRGVEYRVWRRGRETGVSALPLAPVVNTPSEPLN